jgi:hypothetical protein
MAEGAKPKTSEEDTATPRSPNSKPPSAPNEGRLGPTADPAEGKRD